MSHKANCAVYDPISGPCDCAPIRQSNSAQTNQNNSSTPSAEEVNTVESIEAATGSMEDFAEAADLVGLVARAKTNGEALGAILKYRKKVRMSALAERAQGGLTTETARLLEDLAKFSGKGAMFAVNEFVGRARAILARQSTMGSEAAAECSLVPKWAGEFKSYPDWVNHAQRALASPDYARAICVDAKGRRCALGSDMARARDEGAFPVRYFWECELAATQEPVVPRAAVPEDEFRFAVSGLIRALDEYTEQHGTELVPINRQSAMIREIRALAAPSPQEGTQDDAKQARELWQDALSHAAMYVKDHCVDGEDHANAIMGMSVPRFGEQEGKALDTAKPAPAHKYEFRTRVCGVWGDWFPLYVHSDDEAEVYCNEHEDVEWRRAGGSAPVDAPKGGAA